MFHAMLNPTNSRAADLIEEAAGTYNDINDIPIISNDIQW